MREILFRGKRFIGGEWAYGSIITEKNIFDKDMVMTHIYDDKCNVILVIPETVGQYTGLCDNGKNGKKIFEGDIVRYTFDAPDEPKATENGLKHRIGRVFWSEWRASFAVTVDRNGSDVLSNDIARYVRGRSIYEYVSGVNTVEVIGNIYDNPELLEVTNA